MKKHFFLGAAIGFAALFLFSGFMLCRLYWDADTSAKAFEDVACLVESTPDKPKADLPADSEEAPPTPSAYKKYAGVYEQNADFVGWLSIEGTRMDYPVMQTKDRPDYYLKKNFQKQYSDYGVPYAAENCDIDHVGVVERVENGRVYTVEGNSGDACRQNSYPIGYYEIYGYGCPAY